MVFIALYASAIGMAPGTFMYECAGLAAGQVALGAGGGGPEGLGGYALMGLGLVATVAVTVMVTRMARRALRSSPGLAAAG